MPEEPPNHYTWQQCVRDALNILQILALAYVARLGNVNHDQIERKGAEIVQRQDDAVEKSTEVKRTLEAKNKHDREAQTINLWSAWKYLESVADETGKPEDRAKADEAKRVYLEFKNGGH